MSLRLRHATEVDLHSMSLICVSSFREDHLTKQIFPAHLAPDGLDPADELAFRTARTLARLRTPRMESIVVVDDELEGRIVGVAQWQGPWPAAEDETWTAAAKLAKQEEEKGYPPSMDRGAMREFGEAVEKEFVRVFGPRSHKDAWYLIFLGVDPAQQRRGVGTMLARWGVERAAAEGRDAYVISTPAGKSLYLKRGFTELGSLDLRGVDYTSMIIRAHPLTAASGS